MACVAARDDMFKQSEVSTYHLSQQVTVPVSIYIIYRSSQSP